LGEFALNQIENNRAVASVVENPAAVLALLTYLAPGCATNLSLAEWNSVAATMLSLIMRSRNGDLWNIKGGNFTSVEHRCAVGSGVDLGAIGVRLRGLLAASSEALGFVNHRLYTESAGPFIAAGQKWIRRPVVRNDLAWAWANLEGLTVPSETTVVVDSLLPDNSASPWFDAYANPLWSQAHLNSHVVRVIIDGETPDSTVEGISEQLMAAVSVVSEFVETATDDELGRQLLRIMSAAMRLVFPELSLEDLDRFVNTVPEGLIAERASQANHPYILEFLPPEGLELRGRGRVTLVRGTGHAGNVPRHTRFP
jgi:hypothetical protein